MLIVTSYDTWHRGAITLEKARLIACLRLLPVHADLDDDNKVMQEFENNGLLYTPTDFDNFG